MLALKHLIAWTLARIESLEVLHSGCECYTLYSWERDTT
jgi:hypothetical protein